MEIDQELDELLLQDSFAEAERQTGETRDDPATAMLAAWLLDQRTQKLEAMLFLGRDTYHGNSLSYCADVYRELGFELVLAEYIRGNSNYSRVIFWRDGILLFSEVGFGLVTNSRMWLNLRREDINAPLSGIRTLHPEARVWALEVDCLAAMKHNMGKIESFGEILPVWERMPAVDFATLGDIGIEDPKVLTLRILESLPERIRRATNYKELMNDERTEG